ncbi:hypothetical protein GJAV_G00006050 [Gymnothorax javanicus]|nr:hypothetical protein GJAV_G00006050 [Gymnothorax javanicus]
MEASSEESDDKKVRAEGEENGEEPSPPPEPDCPPPPAHRRPQAVRSSSIDFTRKWKLEISRWREGLGELPDGKTAGAPTATQDRRTLAGLCAARAISHPAPPLALPSPAFTRSPHCPQATGCILQPGHKRIKASALRLKESALVPLQEAR